MKSGHEVKKVGICMLFAASCFIAAFVLVEFHEVYIAVAIAGVLLMISAYLLLTVVLANKIREWSKSEEEDSPSNRENEPTEQFREQVVTCLESIDRTQRAMFAMVKRSLEQHETDCTTLEGAIWGAAEKLSAEQTAGIKTLVKYNKENTRQLAVSERQSMSEMKNDISDSISKYAEELKDAISEGIEKISGRAVTLAEISPRTEFVEEAAAVIDEPMSEEPAIEEIEEMAAEPVPEAAEEEPVLDPNAKLSPEDIAKLFAAAEEPQEPAAEEQKIEEQPAPEAAEEEPVLDPNAKLSPEDIAKLFASMGS